MSSEKFQQYQTQKIMTASPAMLVFMLYERAIGCLGEAIACIENGAIEGRWKANRRAMEIIEHMRLTLNMDQGGEIATNLDNIFGYLLRELPKVDLRNDPNPAREGIRLLEPLCESWRQIANKGDDAAKLAAEAAQKIQGSKLTAPRSASTASASTATPAKGKPVAGPRSTASPTAPRPVIISA